MRTTWLPPDLSFDIKEEEFLNSLLAREISSFHSRQPLSKRSIGFGSKKKKNGKTNFKLMENNSNYFQLQIC